MKHSSFGRVDGAMDAGLACLYMVARHFDKEFSLDYFKQAADPGEDGVRMPEISRVAEKIGFRATRVRMSYDQLLKNAQVPCILQWEREKFVVLVKKPSWRNRNMFSCADTSTRVSHFTKEEFIRHWQAHDVLLLEPSFTFRNRQKKRGGMLSWRIMPQFFGQSRLQIAQVIIALLIASLVQLIFPFLMQSVVDVGITTRDLNYITILLAAQFTLVISRVMTEFIRGSLLLHIATMVNLSVLTDFWIKLTNLPVSYFDRSRDGEVLQRITDNRQIQSFLTGPALSILFSIINFIVFAVILVMFKVQLFVVFIVGVVFYFLWIGFFLKTRRKLNYKMFHTSSLENDTTLQLIQGMQEIRLHNIGQQKRWEWERVQAQIFRLSFKMQTLFQFEQSGAMLISQGKDLLVTYLVARSVIEGQLTLGTMLAVQFIIGQLSAPVEQLLTFIQAAQDARLSMERINQVHLLDGEEEEGRMYARQLPRRRTITIEGLSFSYPGDDSRRLVLNNIHMVILEGKTTAIVGESGSGKTTLLKLLLKFYDQYEGNIKIGNGDLRDMSASYFRSQCGVVLKEGYIFPDTVRKNISMEFEETDQDRLIEACRMANILSFVESLPDGFDSRLGAGGMGISQGQTQRLLIARAIYKDPAFIFFDEPTNALDTNNEKAIVGNLELFFRSRTVIVVAHRLSTVMNADNIVMLHEGRVIEQGTHEELFRKRGKYFSLVRNQMELGVG